MSEVNGERYFIREAHAPATFTLKMFFSEPQAEREDLGTYLCHVSNVIGRTTVKFRVMTTIDVHQNTDNDRNQGETNMKEQTRQRSMPPVNMYVASHIRVFFPLTEPKKFTVVIIVTSLTSVLLIVIVLLASVWNCRRRRCQQRIQCKFMDYDISDCSFRRYWNAMIIQYVKSNARVPYRHSFKAHVFCYILW